MQRFIYFYSQKEKAFMKSFYYLPASLLALIVLFSACQKTANAPQVQSFSQDDALNNTTSTLIYKFSFETKDHDTSFAGWTGSLSHSFSKDVPPNAGLWSLQLYPGWLPRQNNAEHFLKLDTGRYRLRFSCYTKVQSNSPDIGIGYIRLIKQRISTTNDSRKTLAETSFSNHDWEINHVTASTIIKPGDVIIIQVSAGASELVTWSTLFDKVKVEKL